MLSPKDHLSSQNIDIEIRRYTLSLVGRSTALLLELDLEIQLIVGLWDKLLYPEMLLNTETESGDLTGTVADHLVLEPHVLLLDKLRLKSRKRDSQFEVEDLPHFHGQSGFHAWALVQFSVEDFHQISLNQRRKQGSVVLSVGLNIWVGIYSCHVFLKIKRDFSFQMVSEIWF